MNDTYGLPIADITCGQPVCHFRPVGSLRSSWSLYVISALGGGVWKTGRSTYHRLQRQVHTTSGKYTRKLTVLIVDEIFTMEISATDTATQRTNTQIIYVIKFSGLLKPISELYKSVLGLLLGQWTNMDDIPADLNAFYRGCHSANLLVKYYNRTK